MVDQSSRIALSADSVGKLIDELVRQLASHFDKTLRLNIVGIRTRGAILADRIVHRLRALGFDHIDHGVIDITLYRDDLSRLSTRTPAGPTMLEMTLDNTPLLIVDDVLSTGRTMRAALDALADFGRPSSTKLAVLVDRGGREVPIEADFAAHRFVDLPKDQRVTLQLRELDGRDEIVVGESVKPRAETPSMPSWTRKHLLEIESLSKDEIELILSTADTFREVSTRSVKKVPALRGKVVVNAFFEDSTRTRMSFSLAAQRLSADVLDFSSAGSSVAKGETLIDTARNIEAMGIDVLVIRHGSSGAPLMLSKALKCSVVNAGDGAHEHPTQGLLDVYTIRQRLGRVEGLNVAIVGDVANSRVARSDLWALTKLGASVTLIGPPTLVPKSFEKLSPGVRVLHDFDVDLSRFDVINMLRVQNERMKSAQFPTIREFTRLFGLTWDRFQRCRKDVLVLHPGPMNRGVEIHNEIADGPSSGILQQVENGLAVRMAVLYLVSQVN